MYMFSGPTQNTLVKLKQKGVDARSRPDTEMYQQFFFQKTEEILETK